MNLKNIFTAAAFLSVFVAVSAAAAAEMKLEAQLIWGTSEVKSPNPKHRPVDADVQHKLASLPLKWSHFFEENRLLFAVADAATGKVTLSDRCAVEVKNLGNNRVEVLLFGKGKEVGKVTQHLPRGEILVLAGNAPGESAWLVTLKRME